MKRVHLAASGLMLSCLLAACGGASTDTTTQEATALTETAQAAVTHQAQAQAARRPAPEQFTGRLREVDETLFWQQTETTVGETTAQRAYSDHVTAVNADGGFAFERFNGAGSVFERYTSDVNDSRLSRDVVSHSNDAGLPNGQSGSAAYSQEGTCWWAPALKRLIKCDIDSNFGATAPASYRLRYAMNLTAIVVP